MSTTRKPKSDLLWLERLEPVGSQYDGGPGRGSSPSTAVRAYDEHDDADEEEAREWRVIERMLLSWQAPRDS